MTLPFLEGVLQACTITLTGLVGTRWGEVVYPVENLTLPAVKRSGLRVSRVQERLMVRVEDIDSVI